MKQLRQVAEWHKTFNVPILEEGGHLSMERINLRKNLILEEMTELEEAHKGGDIEKIAKEVCDLIYVSLGTALEFGWSKKEYISMFETGFGQDTYKAENLDSVRRAVGDFCKSRRPTGLDLVLIHIDDYLDGMNLSEVIERCFDEVHRSNMSKLGLDGNPILRKDGKVLKGVNYSPADMSFLKN